MSKAKKRKENLKTNHGIKQNLKWNNEKSCYNDYKGKFFLFPKHQLKSVLSLISKSWNY